MDALSEAALERLVVDRSVALILARLQKLAVNQRPQTRDKLLSFVKAATRDRLKVYAFDPRDGVQYARDNALLSAETARGVLEILADVQYPSDMESAPAPRHTWPSTLNHEWMRVPGKMHPSELARWFCARARVCVRVPADKVVQELFDQYKVRVESGNKLQYTSQDQSGATGGKWSTPWSVSVQKSIKAALTQHAEAALTQHAELTIHMDEDSADYSKVDRVRWLHDADGHADAKAHIKLFKPFFRADRLLIPGVKRKLAALGCAAFDIRFDNTCIEAAAEDPTICTISLKPDEASTSKIQRLRECLRDALPPLPGADSGWFLPEERQQAVCPDEEEPSRRKKLEKRSQSSVQSTQQVAPRLPVAKFTCIDRIPRLSRFCRSSRSRSRNRRNSPETVGDERIEAFKQARHDELLGTGPVTFRVARLSICERKDSGLEETASISLSVS